MSEQLDRFPFVIATLVDTNQPMCVDNICICKVNKNDIQEGNMVDATRALETIKMKLPDSKRDYCRILRLSFEEIFEQNVGVQNVAN